jgi:hypothetical protein
VRTGDEAGAGRGGILFRKESAISITERNTTRYVIGRTRNGQDGFSASMHARNPSRTVCTSHGRKSSGWTGTRNLAYRYRQGGNCGNLYVPSARRMVVNLLAGRTFCVSSARLTPFLCFSLDDTRVQKTTSNKEEISRWGGATRRNETGQVQSSIQPSHPTAPPIKSINYLDHGDLCLCTSARWQFWREWGTQVVSGHRSWTHNH